MDGYKAVKALLPALAQPPPKVTSYFGLIDMYAI